MNNLEKSTNIKEIVNDQKVDLAEIKDIANNLNAADFKQELQKYSKEIFEGIKQWILDTNWNINNTIYPYQMDDYLKIINFILPDEHQEAALKDRIVKYKYEKMKNFYSNESTAHSFIINDLLWNKDLKDIPESIKSIASYQLVMARKLTIDEWKRTLSMINPTTKEPRTRLEVSNLLSDGRWIGTKIPFDLYHEYSEAFQKARWEQIKKTYSIMFSWNPDLIPKVYNLTTGDWSGTNFLWNEKNNVREAGSYWESQIRQTRSINFDNNKIPAKISIVPSWADSGIDTKTNKEYWWWIITLRLLDSKWQIQYITWTYKNNSFVMNPNPSLHGITLEKNWLWYTISIPPKYSNYKVELITRSWKYETKNNYDEINFGISTENANLTAALKEPNSYLMSNNYEQWSYKLNDQTTKQIKEISENIIFDLERGSEKNKALLNISIWANDVGYNKNSIDYKLQINQEILPNIKKNMKQSLNLTTKKDGILIWDQSDKEIYSTAYRKITDLNIDAAIIAGLSDKFKWENVEYRDLHISLIKSRYLNVMNELIKDPEMIRNIASWKVSINPIFTQSLDIGISTTSQ